MTSFAFILGVVPLVVSSGAGPKCARHSERQCSSACRASLALGSSSLLFSMLSLCGSRSDPLPTWRRKRPQKFPPRRIELSKPVRVQLKRSKGWRMPPNTVKVDRSSRWGNPFVICKVAQASRLGKHAQTELVGKLVRDRERAIALFKQWISGPSEVAAEWRGSVHELRDRNLACWCPLDGPFHADVLLELANR
jgi:hypothetical protein